MKQLVAAVGKPYSTCRCGGTTFLQSSLLNYYSVCSTCGRTLIVKSRA